MARTAAVVGLYLLLCLLSWNQIEEDAYIYFRLAENIAAGFGYVFNRGGPPIESGSSPLWQLLLVGLALLPLPIVTSTKLLGTLFGALCLVLTGRLAARFSSDPLVRITPPLVTALSLPFLMWSHRGLETPLYIAIVLWLALALVEPQPTRRWWLPACALIVARPEGGFVLLALLPFFALHRERVRELARPLPLLALFVVAVTACRLFYFGDLVPHTFYVKMSASPTAGARGALAYLAGSGLALFALPLLLGLPRRSFWSAPWGALLATLAVMLAWSLLVSEFKPWFRHLAPALPLASVACACGFERLVRPTGPRGRWLVRGFCAAFVLATAAPREVPVLPESSQPHPLWVAAARLLAEPGPVLAGTWSKLADPEALTVLDEDAGKEGIGSNYQTLVGRFLRANAPSGARVVYDQMGQTPYFAGHDKFFIDSYGIADRTAGYHQFSQRAERGPLLRAYRAVAGLLLPELRRGVSTREALDYVFDADPDLLLVNEFVVRARPRSLPAAIRSDPRLRERYAPRARLGRVVAVYERRPVSDRTLEIPPGLSVAELLR